MLEFRPNNIPAWNKSQLHRVTIHSNKKSREQKHKVTSLDLELVKKSIIRKQTDAACM